MGKPNLLKAAHENPILVAGFFIKFILELVMRKRGWKN